jgi:hypothetical protein
MTRATVAFRLFSACALLSLAACGGGAPTVGGTLSGLGSGLSVALQNNNGDTLTLSANGSFTFPTALADGGTYSVTVLTQPVGQTCSVGNPSGTIDATGDDVTNVSVTCATTASLGGSVSGLASGTSVTVSNNGGTSVPIASNGQFAFPGILAAGTAYDVKVVTQPAGQSCVVTNPSGTIAANVMSVVGVVCQ